jgi:replicative DNA helicase
MQNEAPPHDTELEQAVLGAIMLQPEGESELLSKLAVDDFWGDPERTVARVLWDMSANGEPLGPDAVVARLRERDLLQRLGGTRYVADVLGMTPAIAPKRMGRFVQRLHELSKRRRLIVELRSLTAAAYDVSDGGSVSDAIDGAQGRLQAISGRGERDTFHTLKDSARSLFQQLQDEMQAKADGRFVRAGTGLAKLDGLIGGLYRGQLIIVAARPSMGKTALMLNMATAVARASSSPCQGAHVISAETTHTRIAGRVVSGEARVDTGRMFRGAVDDDAWRRLTASTQWAGKLPLTIDDRSAPTLQQIRGSIRRAQIEHRRIDADGNVTQELGAVFVDYLQLASNPNKRGNREQEVGGIAYGLHDMAKDFDVPIVALSQLNRALEGRKDKRPQLSDLRESGNIEQAADVILGLYRGEYYDATPENAGLADVIILKAKEGATGAVRVKFTKQWMQFADLEESW